MTFAINHSHEHMEGIGWLSRCLLTERTVGEEVLRTFRTEKEKLQEMAADGESFSSCLKSTAP